MNENIRTLTNCNVNTNKKLGIKIGFNTNRFYNNEEVNNTWFMLLD